MIKQEHIDRAMSYGQYVKLLNDLMEQGRTTGENQSENYLNYAKLNLQRMSRLEKTVELTYELKTALAKITTPSTWVVITEGWCGDAAQNLPVLHAMEKQCPAIELKLLLRDENLDVMDQYLTNGSRSIPKVIAVRKDEAGGSYKELFVWGPRPDAAQQIMIEYKSKNLPHDELALAIQKWYNADHTLSVQSEMLALLERV